jgi:1-phosphatidylinositol phosphodiesterase
MRHFALNILASLSSTASANSTPCGATFLAQLALQHVLSDASPIFGYYAKNGTEASTWMKEYPDSTKPVHMNLPGAHDAQTWNYSFETQEASNM